MYGMSNYVIEEFRFAITFFWANSMFFATFSKLIQICQFHKEYKVLLSIRSFSLQMNSAVYGKSMPFFKVWHFLEYYTICRFQKKVCLFCEVLFWLKVTFLHKYLQFLNSLRFKSFKSGGSLLQIFMPRTSMLISVDEPVFLYPALSDCILTLYCGHQLGDLVVH